MARRSIVLGLILAAMAPKRSAAGLTYGHAPRGMTAHVRVKLAPGWRYDETARVFRNLATGEMRAALQGVLRGATVVAVAPDYAKADPKSLSRDEENLARYVQIILPRGLSVGEALHQVRGWDFVDRAEAAPSVNLP